MYKTATQINALFIFDDTNFFFCILNNDNNK